MRAGLAALALVLLFTSDTSEDPLGVRKINWGRSQPARTNVPTQLARVQRATPADFTIYLYGWDTPEGTNNVLGRYTLTYGAGGIATREEVVVPARGQVRHYVATVVQVDTVANQSPPVGSVARAFVGMGRPTPFQMQGQGSALGGAGPGSIIRLPPWLTSLRLLGQFGPALTTPGTDGQIQIANANDPAFGGPATYDIAELFDGWVPLNVASGFIRFVAPTVDLTISYQINGFQ